MFQVLPISAPAFMPVAPATICDRDHEMTGFFPRTGAQPPIESPPIEFHFAKKVCT
jgi:hypothetical protein